MALRVCGCAVSVSTPPFGISALAGTEVPRCALRRCALRRWLAGTPLTSFQSRTGTSACVRAGCSQRCVLLFSGSSIIALPRLNPTSRVRVTSRPTPMASAQALSLEPPPAHRPPRGPPLISLAFSCALPIIGVSEIISISLFIPHHRRFKLLAASSLAGSLAVAGLSSHLIIRLWVTCGSSAAVILDSRPSFHLDAG